MSTGISAATWNEYKKLPMVVAPGTGGEECLKRCGLNFTEVRPQTLSPLQSTHSPSVQGLPPCMPFEHRTSPVLISATIPSEITSSVAVPRRRESDRGSLGPPATVQVVQKWRYYVADVGTGMFLAGERL